VRDRSALVASGAVATALVAEVVAPGVSADRWRPALALLVASVTCAATAVIVGRANGVIVRRPNGPSGRSNGVIVRRPNGPSGRSNGPVRRADGTFGRADGTSGRTRAPVPHLTHLAGPALPALVGVALVVARVALGGLAGSVAEDTLPSGDGPWPAVVESIGTPHDARQVAVLGLDVAGGPRVAASLPRFPAVEPGDRIEVSGRLEPPGNGGYGDYLRRARLAGSLRAMGVVVHGRADGAMAGLEGLRRAGGEALTRVLPEPEAGLAAGILIGLRDRVDRDVSAAFTTAGVTHVVAISGWNIAIVAAAIAALTGRWRRGRRAVVTLAAIACYTLIAGASPSVVRAAAMAGVVSLAREGGRGIRASSALAWAAVLLLLVEPRTVIDPGFQLSALATAGLIAWATPLTAWVSRLGTGRVGTPAWLAEGLGVSLAAQAATLPLVLVLFGRLSLVAPVVNLAIVPLVPASMAGGLLALGAGLAAAVGLPDPVADALAMPAWLLFTAMIRIVDIAAGLPLASLTIGPPGSHVVASAAMAICVAVAQRRRLRPAVDRILARGPAHRRSGSSAIAADAAHTGGRPLLAHAGSLPAGGPLPAAGPLPATGPLPARVGRLPTAGSPGGRSSHRARRPSPSRPDPGRLARALRRPLLVLAGAALAVSLVAAARPDGRTHVTVLDVGQGDAILVQTPQGGRLLVDGGPDPDRLVRSLDGRLPPWDHRLDLVVLTHPHEDHVAGLPLVLGRYLIGRVFEPGFPGNGPGYAAFVATLRSRGISPERLHSGDRLRLDEVAVQVLWPDATAIPEAEPDTGRGVNDLSIVLLADVDGRRVLLGADAEDDVDPILVARGLPRIAVLKVAHHGSRTSTSDALLAAAAPSIALISVGAGNSYGHPSRITLDRLMAHGAQVHRSDREGSLDVAFGPGALTVAAERAAGGGVSLLYHPDDVRSRAGRGRLPAALARPATVVPPPFARGRGGRRLARGARPGRRGPRRSIARGIRGPPARRRQARPSVRSGGTSAPR
jgi:competence protein ComEC